MNTFTINPTSLFKRKFLFGIFVLIGLMLSSYKSTACTASFTYTAGVNGHYSFTSTSVGVGRYTFYTWNAGDGNGWHGGSTTFSHIYKTNGTFTARLAIMDSSLTCVDTASVSITVSNVNTPCTLAANFTYTVTPHGVVNYTSTSTGTNAYTQYYWRPGDSNLYVRGTTTYTHKYLFQGFYTMWLTVKDTGLSYCIDSIPETIDVNSADSSHCHLHADFSYTVGPNGQITFKDSSTGVGNGAQYYWFLNNSWFFSGKGPFTHTFATNGTYSVILSVGDSSCHDSITIPVTVTNACNLQSNFTWRYDSAGQVLLTSTSTGTNGTTTYKWTFGDGSPYVKGMGSNYDTVTHSYPFLGYYTVTLWDSNAGGCVSSVSKTLYVYNKDSLQACFTYFADSVHAGQYDFSASCSKGTYQYTYYKWTPGDGDPSDSGLGMTTYNHTYLHNGPHNATLTIWYTILPHKPMLHSNPEYDLSSVTEVINVTTATGIASISDSRNYTIYPNPSNGTFNIGLNGIANGQNAEIRISNVIGQLIYDTHTTLHGNAIPVTMGASPNGIYLLQVITAANTYTCKIIVQK